MENTYPFINGDHCEKGLNSLELVYYVQEMQRTLSRVFIAKEKFNVVFRHVFAGRELGRSYLNVHQNQS